MLKKIFIPLQILFFTPLFNFSQSFEYSGVRPLNLLEEGYNNSVPIISEKNSKYFFIRNLNNKLGNFGGILPKKIFWFSEEWLALYENNNKYNEDLYNIIIEKNSAEDEAYLTDPHSSNYHPSKFKGIFITKRLKGYWNTPKILNVKGGSLNKVFSFFMNKECDLLILSLAIDENTYGEEDLYYTLKGKDGKWSPLTNLGPTINTSGSEISPFFDETKNILYFSSTGHSGFGKMDVFYSERLYNSSWKVWSKPNNMGEKINSSNNEVYYNIENDTIGFFVQSNEYNKAEIIKTRISPKRSAIPTTNNREYLSDYQINETLGLKADNLVITFDKGVIKLSDESKELLWFIVNKIKFIPDIRLNLLFSDDSEEIDNLSTRRAFAISQYMESLGVSPNRISTDKVNDERPNNKIFIKLFR